MPNQAPVHIARERNRILRELAAQKNLEFRQSFIGKTLSAITLHRANRVSTEALTSNYLKVELEGVHSPNRWIQAEITAVTDDGLCGFATSPGSQRLAFSIQPMQLQR